MTVVQRLVSKRSFAQAVLSDEIFDVAEEAVHAAEHMWEISPSQRAACGIFRESPYVRVACDISHMDQKPDIAALRVMIERQMEAKGFSRRSLSMKAGLSPTAVRDVLERTDNPGIGTLHKIAHALELPFEAMTGAAGIELVGQIGAGGLIAYFKDGEEHETVPRPPIGGMAMIAFEVAGESMLPKYEAGDVVYVRRDHNGLLPDYLDRYCAVHLNDGGTYLKTLTRGSRPGVYTLRSLNAADMTDVDVVWASPVLFVMPRYARQRLAKDAADEGA